MQHPNQYHYQSQNQPQHPHQVAAGIVAAQAGRMGTWSGRQQGGTSGAGAANASSTQQARGNRVQGAHGATQMSGGAAQISGGSR